MPECDEHKGDRRINCHNCYTNEELQAAIEELNKYKLPAAPGARKQPKRADDPTTKKKKPSWMDELL